MKKTLSLLIIAGLSLNLAMPPVFAEEYMMLPPIMEEGSEQDNNQDYYTQTTPPLKGTVSTVPVGTAFQVMTDDNLNSKRSQVGEIFTATLNQPITVSGDIIVPAGSEVTGQVTYLQDAGRVGKNAKMEIKFTSIKPLYGNKIPIIGKVLTQDNTGILKGGSLKEQLVKHVKTEAIATAAGTAAGAGIGAILGGVTAGTGAAVGAISGAGLGLAYIFWRKGKEVRIPTGTKMIVVLEQPFTVGN